jgi:hypothetical protein
VVDDVNCDTLTCRNKRKKRVEGMGVERWETWNNKLTEKKSRRDNGKWIMNSVLARSYNVWGSHGSNPKHGFVFKLLNMFFGGYLSTILRNILSLPLGWKPSTMEREKQEVSPNHWCPRTKPDDVKCSKRSLVHSIKYVFC